MTFEELKKTPNVCSDMVLIAKENYILINLLYILINLLLYWSIVKLFLSNVKIPTIGLILSSVRIN